MCFGSIFCICAILCINSKHACQFNALKSRPISVSFLIRTSGKYQAGSTAKRLITNNLRPVFSERDVYFGHKCHFIEKVQNDWMGWGYSLWPLGGGKWFRSRKWTSEELKSQRELGVRWSMRARKRRRKFFEEQKRKRGKEEAAFNRAQKGQDGEQGDKQVRRRSLLEEQKRKRLSERTRG